MRQIKLTDNEYEFLKDLCHELNTQETDCQADPRYWGVLETREVGVPEGCGEPRIYMGDGGTGTLKEAVDYIKEYIPDERPATRKAWRAVNKENMTEVVIFAHRYLDWNDWRIVDMDKREFVSQETGAFLTKRACKEYIKKYGYNHSHPQTYAMTAYRNFELWSLLKLLKNIKFD